MAGLTIVLAFTSYEEVPLLRDDDVTLNLAWTLDEQEFLAVDVAAVLSRELGNEVHEGLPFLRSYFVHDPYGEGIIGEAVSRFFSVGALDVTCGAGVDSLLQALAPLAQNAAVIGEVYPDLPHWVARLGGRCIAFDGRAADAVVLERPALIGETVSLPQLADLARGAGMVIVDESYANYAPPAYSAVTLVPRVPNLIVLRGVSKAYQQGGLRFAYCVTSPDLTERVRTLIAPLLASSLSLRLARALLELGDITAPLRARIAAGKAELQEQLKRIGCGRVAAAPDPVPYVFISDDDVPRIRQCGIVGKYQPFWSGGSVVRRYRLSVPLSESRLQELKRR